MTSSVNLYETYIMLNKISKDKILLLCNSIYIKVQKYKKNIFFEVRPVVAPRK